MPRVIPGLQVIAWLEGQPDERRRTIDRWFLTLAAGDVPPELASWVPNPEPIPVEIPDTDVIAYCLVSPVLDAIAIARIEPSGR